MEMKEETSRAEVMNDLCQTFFTPSDVEPANSWIGSKYSTSRIVCKEEGDVNELINTDCVIPKSLFFNTLTFPKGKKKAGE
jgi:hypothetical protein